MRLYKLNKVFDERETLCKIIKGSWTKNQKKKTEPYRIMSCTSNSSEKEKINLK